MKMICVRLCLERKYSESFALLQILLNIPDWNSVTTAAISQVCFSGLRNEVMSFLYLGQRAGLLLVATKAVDFPNSVFLSCDASSLWLVQHLSWFIILVLWDLGLRRTSVNMLTLTLNFMLCVVKTLVSDPGISCLLLVSMKLFQANLACT